MTNQPKKHLSSWRQRAHMYLLPIFEWARHQRCPATIDHIGYGCETSQEFDNLRALLEPESTYLFQSWISGRRIAIVKLNEPIPTNMGPIWFVELADRKPSGQQQDGFNHIELIPSLGSMQDLIEWFRQHGHAIEQKVRPHHTTYDTQLPSGRIIRLTEEPLIAKIKREEFI